MSLIRNRWAVLGTLEGALKGSGKSKYILVLLIRFFFGFTHNICFKTYFVS